MAAFAVACGPVPPTPQNKRRVAVVGGGVAGLATALVLGKRRAELGVATIDIFEPRQSLDINLGSAINLNGGAAILSKRYGMEIPLWDAASPFNQVSGLDTAGNSLFHVNIDRELSKRPDKHKLIHNGRPQIMTLMRDDLMRVLDDALDRDVVNFHRGEAVSKVVSGSKPETKNLILSSGRQDQTDYDLVIGADGLNSIIRKVVAPEASVPVYSGIRIQYAVGRPGPPKSDLQYGMLQQHFGNGGYALRYAAGLPDSRRDLLAFCYVNPEERSENEEYLAEDALRQDYTKRMRAAGMQGPLLELVEEAERLIEVGVYFHYPLKTWSAEQCVLVGDSSHALPPFLGQGANQAIQDAHALANAISKHRTLEEALAVYEAERKPTTTAILQASRLIGAIETAGGIGATARNVLFRSINLLGVPGKAFLTAAMPAVEI